MEARLYTHTVAICGDTLRPVCSVNGGPVQCPRAREPAASPLDSTLLDSRLPAMAESRSTRGCHLPGRVGIPIQPPGTCGILLPLGGLHTPPQRGEPGCPGASLLGPWRAHQHAIAAGPALRGRGDWLRCAGGCRLLLDQGLDCVDLPCGGAQGLVWCRPPQRRPSPR